MNLTLDNVVNAPVSIEAKFDFLYDCAVKVLAKWNPCKITFKDKAAHCVGCGFNGNEPNTLCCNNCQFHTEKGCAAEKPLTCKLWLCNVAIRNFRECDIELQEVRKPFNQLDLYSFRGDKKMSLQGHREMVND